MKAYKKGSTELMRTQEAIIEALAPGSPVLITTVGKFNKCDNGKGFFAITALAAATLDVSAMTGMNVQQNISGTMSPATTDISIPAGVTIYGNFPSITLATGSGPVMAYARSTGVLTGEA